MEEPVDINQWIDNPEGHDHERVYCEVTIGDDIGFIWNKQSQSYDLITDRQTWKRSIPIERMLQKITQEYAVQVLKNVATSQGFEIEQKKITRDGSIELVVNRWT